jgi:2-oxoglutarate ferredoxin oxidoreductase subunit alpha
MAIRFLSEKGSTGKITAPRKSRERGASGGRGAVTSTKDDGIPYRTLPGEIDNPTAAYFTRGSGHTERATYSEKPEDYERNMDLLARKFETVKRSVPRSVIETVSGSRVGLIAYGSSDFAVQEARHLLPKGDPRGLSAVAGSPFDG